MSTEGAIRSYAVDDVIAFRFTGEKYGGLSNFAPGYAILANGERFYTSEAFYQALKHTHKPDLQRRIMLANSPYKAKKIAYEAYPRADWNRRRIDIMRYVLKAKLVCNWSQFSGLLLGTADAPLVEHSEKDVFWGAKTSMDGGFVGVNALGRLLMELRDLVIGESPELDVVNAPVYESSLRLFDHPLKPIKRKKGE